MMIHETLEIIKSAKDWPLGEYLIKTCPDKFNDFCNHYDEEVWCFDRNYALYQLVISLGGNKADRVIDIGCGNGLQSEIFELPYVGLESTPVLDANEVPVFWEKNNGIARYYICEFPDVPEYVERLFENAIVTSSMCLSYWDDMPDKVVELIGKANCLFITAHDKDYIEKLADKLSWEALMLEDAEELCEHKLTYTYLLRKR